MELHAPYRMQEAGTYACCEGAYFRIETGCGFAEEAHQVFCLMFLRIAVLSLVIQLVGREETSRILKYDKVGLQACVYSETSHIGMKGGQGHTNLLHV